MPGGLCETPLLVLDMSHRSKGYFPGRRLTFTSKSLQKHSPFKKFFAINLTTLPAHRFLYNDISLLLECYEGIQEFVMNHQELKQPRGKDVVRVYTLVASRFK
jgi:hypothetical protein